MTQHDEVSGLRDIIKHDMVMDARALEKLEEAQSMIRTFGANNADDLLAKLEEIGACIKSTTTDAKVPGTLSLGLVE